MRMDISYSCRRRLGPPPVQSPGTEVLSPHPPPFKHGNLKRIRYVSAAELTIVLPSDSIDEKALKVENISFVIEQFAYII